MKERKNVIIAIGLFLPLAIYVTLSLTLMCFYFGYLNQGYTTQTDSTAFDKELTFLNYLLPFFLTIGFIFLFVIDSIKKFNSKDKGSALIGLLILCISGETAILWQIEHLEWLYKKSRTDYYEWSPFVIGISITIYVVAQKIINFRKRKKNVAQ
ncbi:hypothetical protein EFA69_14210 [Rufibacter immobilis]|uniref:Uncharacterized protein n=1 Tax=Rufibacter immobilis TaxID=1348778 RepID=A0A3M9MRG3_9BACT|nr:hypothetical protein [Rufibacter immobilis]RNI27298.1 hypothetical protein EFA69_14210 [Rufibacter immobilis]